MSLKCFNCGKLIETLPIECGYSITLNNETKQWECDIEDCGTISFDKFLCNSCCTDKNIMKINRDIERLSVENEEFNEELGVFKKQIVQTTLYNSDFKYWVEFGEGVFKCGKGEKDDATIMVSCPQKIMKQMLTGNLDFFTEFFLGNLKIEGDLQYAVVYFDLINLALNINAEIGGI